MADGRLKAWLRQARADLDAGRSQGGDECHRRYWLQQASEKGIKALGLAMWNGPTADEGVFRAAEAARRGGRQKSPPAQVALAPAPPD